MKKFTLLLTILALGAIAYSCNNSHANPRAAARSFCDAFFVENDFNKAMEFTTGDARRQLTTLVQFRNEYGTGQMEELLESDLAKSVTADISDVQQSGDNAVVYVTVKAKSKDYGDFESDESLRMVKIDGKWYVSEF